MISSSSLPYFFDVNNPDFDILFQISIPELLQNYGGIDPREVAFKKNLPVPAPVLVDLLLAHKKAPNKFPSWYKNSLILLKSEVEQASGEFAAIKKAEIISESKIADLTCALGFDSLAFLKAGKQVICSELNGHTLEFAKHNHAKFNLSADTYLIGNAEDVWRKMIGEVNALYLDPMRRSTSERFIDIRDFQPDFSKIVREALPFFESIWVKLSPMIDISFLHKNFTHIAETHVISVDDECKEILLRFQKKPDSSKNWVHCCRSNGNDISFQTDMSDFNPKPESPNTEQQQWVIIPDAAIRKWKISDQVAEHLGIELASKNTHVFLSNSRFPQIGRHFRLLNETNIKLSGLKELLHNHGMNRVSFDLHNVPFSEVEARKKTGIKDGPDGHVILFSGERNSLSCLICAHSKNND